MKTAVLSYPSGGYTNLALSPHTRYTINNNLHKHSMIPFFIMQRGLKKAVICAGS
jgi:hypothetical protein